MSDAESNKPGIAAVLSLIIPGVGQFYNGTFWKGIFWLIITPGSKELKNDRKLISVQLIKR